ncbi:transporter [Mucilaginibacter terrigena]|uniref:Transporter n=1 Tax=Mucilaginibacter terrigena TaxID=2492395 RepID=A0A4Q5LIC3_9SPHI|nr:transporter [Mucilaginibacter terrigena]RYU87855.1 transporter [Mucilaginibacter terrigena]
MRFTISLLLISLLTTFAYAQTDTARHKYSLFNPVPKDKMKDMETDRPDVTESAYTVEAGHFQVETDLFKHTRNSSDGVNTIQNDYNLANYKLGLTQKMDIQLVMPTYVNITTRDLKTGKIIDKTGGFDDISVRLKYNLWGNDGGKTAFALLPFIKLPTSSFANNGLQGGLTLPFALKINDNWSFGTQVSVSVAKEDDDNYHGEYLYSFTFGRLISKRLDCFIEAYANYNAYSKITDTYANGGLIFSVTDNLNIDTGLNYGLSKTADKVYFVGLSFRY